MSWPTDCRQIAAGAIVAVCPSDLPPTQIILLPDQSDEAFPVVSQVVTEDDLMNVADAYAGNMAYFANSTRRCARCAAGRRRSRRSIHELFSRRQQEQALRGLYGISLTDTFRESTWCGILDAGDCSCNREGGRLPPSLWSGDPEAVARTAATHSAGTPTARDLFCPFPEWEVLGHGGACLADADCPGFEVCERRCVLGMALITGT